MTEENNTTMLAQTSARKPVTIILAVLALAIVAGFAIYLNMQRNSLVDQTSKLNEDVRSLKNQIGVLEGQKVEAARLSQEYLTAIEAEEVVWSKALTRIKSLVPFDAVNSSNKIIFSSYSGSKGGELSMNSVTRPTRSDPYEDVAELINVFNGSSFFTNAYVPSISRGETDEGEKLATFVFNVTYREELPEEISVSQPSSDTDVPKVPRQ